MKNISQKSISSKSLAARPSHPAMTAQSPMYKYATEMVSAYYKSLKIEGKKVLSIIGSGDQIINAYFFGAKDVVGFDINRRATFMLELKVAAIKNLSLEEFFEFFGHDAVSGNLNFNYYQRIKKDISLPARTFFQKVYFEFEKNGKKLIKSDYFRNRSMIKASAPRINDYLKNHKNYLQCRAKLERIKLNYFILDINDISSSIEIKGRFDIINLSNVLNYVTGNINEQNCVNVINNLLKNVAQKLNNTGLLFFYSYSPNFYNFNKNNIPPASRLSILNQIKTISVLNLSFKKFKGLEPGMIDRINVFTKRLEK